VKSKTLFLVISYSLILTLVGCEAFVRKFTRKPKAREFPEQEMVLAPEEYQALSLSPAQRYQQDFLFWKTWQDELIISLQEGRSWKKQVDCLREAIKSLENLRPLFKEEFRETLERHLAQEKALLEAVENDVYGAQTSAHLSRAERIRRSVLRTLSFGKIKGYLLEEP
jgi:DNA repair ATPase RecN